MTELLICMQGITQYNAGGVGGGGATRFGVQLCPLHVIETGPGKMGEGILITPSPLFSTEANNACVVSPLLIHVHDSFPNEPRQLLYQPLHISKIYKIYTLKH